MFAVGHQEAAAYESPAVKRCEEDGTDLQDVSAEGGRELNRCKKKKDGCEEGYADCEWWRSGAADKHAVYRKKKNEQEPRCNEGANGTTHMGSCVLWQVGLKMNGGTERCIYFFQFIDL